MISLDVEMHTWCPSCGAVPGEACPAGGRLHVDHDGSTHAHMPRIRRADALTDGREKWRRDELIALVDPLVQNGALYREGRADRDV